MKYIIKRNFGAMITYLIDWDDNGEIIRSRIKTNAKVFSEDEIDNALEHTRNLQPGLIFTKEEVS